MLSLCPAAAATTRRLKRTASIGDRYPCRMPEWPPVDRDDRAAAAASRAGFDTDIPLLVPRLIAETVDGCPSSTCRAAAGPPLEAPTASAADRRTIEVPSGTSVWELSATDKAQGKADDNYSKYLAAPDGMATKDVTHVQAILATWAKCRTWATARRKEGPPEGRWRAEPGRDPRLARPRARGRRPGSPSGWAKPCRGSASSTSGCPTWLPSTNPSTGPEIALAGRQDQARQARRDIDADKLYFLHLRGPRSYC